MGRDRYTSRQEKVKINLSKLSSPTQLYVAFSVKRWDDGELADEGGGRFPPNLVTTVATNARTSKGIHRTIFCLLSNFAHQSFDVYVDHCTNRSSQRAVYMQYLRFVLHVLYRRSLSKLLAASVTPTADSRRCVYYSLLLYCVALISPSIKYLGSLFGDAQTSQHAIRRKRNFTRASFRPVKAPALFRAASCGPTLQRRRFCRVSQSHVFRARAAVEYAREAPLLVPLGDTGGGVISHARKKNRQTKSGKHITLQAMTIELSQVQLNNVLRHVVDNDCCSWLSARSRAMSCRHRGSYKRQYPSSNDERNTFTTVYTTMGLQSKNVLSKHS